MTPVTARFHHHRNSVRSDKLSRKTDDTLQGTNVSHEKSLLKMIFLFPRWDMLVPWRVCSTEKLGEFAMRSHKKILCLPRHWHLSRKGDEILPSYNRDDNKPLRGSLWIQSVQRHGNGIRSYGTFLTSGARRRLKQKRWMSAGMWLDQNFDMLFRQGTQKCANNHVAPKSSSGRNSKNFLEDKSRGSLASVRSKYQLSIEDKVKWGIQPSVSTVIFRNSLNLEKLHSLKLIVRLKRKRSYSKYPFSGANWLLVSGRGIIVELSLVWCVWKLWNNFKLQQPSVSLSELTLTLRSLLM